MEKYNLPKDIKVFGIKVTTFPKGIGEAFDELIKKTGDPAGERAYYGISFFEKGSIVYVAAAEEKDAGEPRKYNCESYIIDAGNYVASSVRGWRKKTDCIKDVCNSVVMDPQSDKTKPCIEWYKNEDDMMVMVKMK